MKLLPWLLPWLTIFGKKEKGLILMILKLILINNNYNYNYNYNNNNNNNNHNNHYKFQKNHQTRGGDWICDNCKNLNFSYRFKCKICSTQQTVNSYVFS
jgi:outer membrane receptor protein involved in Fe transport